MASGRLGTANLTAAIGAKLYTVGAGNIATVNLLFCNRGTTDATVSAGICTGNTPTEAEWIEHGMIVPAKGGAAIDTALVLSAGESIYVISNTSNVSVRAHGIEETA
jgi:hypothetical protein